MIAKQTIVPYFLACWPRTLSAVYLDGIKKLPCGGMKRCLWTSYWILYMKVIYLLELYMPKTSIRRGVNRKGRILQMHTGHFNQCSNVYMCGHRRLIAFISTLISARTFTTPFQDVSPHIRPTDPITCYLGLHWSLREDRDTFQVTLQLNYNMICIYVIYIFDLGLFYTCRLPSYSPCRYY